MNVNDVPQDNSKTFNGERKIIYAQNQQGYQGMESTGWEIEEYATAQAVAEYQRQTKAAFIAVQRGEKSPLYFHMLNMRFDEPGLAMAAGVWQWQLRRHFQPKIFAKLSDKTLQKYAQAFQMRIADIQQLPSTYDE